MKVFLDDDNREWKLHLTWDNAEQIYTRCERPDSTPEERKTFDLFNITNKEQVEAFVVYDPHTGRFNVQHGRYIVNILYLLCEEQCKERNISDLDFGNMMMSSLFSRAYEALMGEIENFIPSPEQKTAFQNLLYLAGGTQQTALSELNQILTKARTAVDAQINQKAAEAADMMETAMKNMATDLKAAEESSTTSS
jgi:hypothetical protein